jgi:hypothetical protein
MELVHRQGETKGVIFDNRPWTVDDGLIIFRSKKYDLIVNPAGSLPHQAQSAI